MKIIDITKELFSAAPFPGDPAPSMKLEKTLKKDGYNLTVFSACAHNSTHIDAPCHFVSGGSTAADIELDKCVGKCVVTDNIGSAIEYAERGEKRILLKNVNVTPTQAERLASAFCCSGSRANLSDRIRLPALCTERCSALESSCSKISTFPQRGAASIFCAPCRLK